MNNGRSLRHCSLHRSLTQVDQARTIEQSSTASFGYSWILKTGAQWEDLPERYGPSKTVSSRLYRWRKVGIWDKVLAELQRQGDTLGEVQWTIHYVDGTVVRAHQSAAGAKRGTQKREVQ